MREWAVTAVVQNSGGAAIVVDVVTIDICKKRISCFEERINHIACNGCDTYGMFKTVMSSRRKDQRCNVGLRNTAQAL